MYTVNEYAETLLAQRISMISGVSRVQVFGAQKYAVRVQVDPEALAAHNIGIDEVQRAIQTSNTNLPTGRLDGDKQAFTIQSTGTLAERERLPPDDRRLAQWNPRSTGATRNRQGFCRKR